MNKVVPDDNEELPRVGYWSDDVFTPNSEGYSTASKLADEINNGSSIGDVVEVHNNTITLLKDIKLGWSLSFTSNIEPITLNLNNHIISRESKECFAIIVIATNGSLILNDESDDEKTEKYFRIKDDDNKALSEWTLVPNESEEIEKSCITLEDIELYEKKRCNLINRDVDEKYDSKHIKITGGIITGGCRSGSITSNLSGGGVSVIDNTGRFEIKGGNIVGNGAFDGGGVDNKGTFIMAGGNIGGNHAACGGGGVNNNGNFMMTGGNIVGNTAETRGGGVAIGWLPFYVRDGKSSLYMSGGNITGNEATYGGGVWCRETFKMNGGNIRGNITLGGGGGVLLEGRFDMSGSSIIINNVAVKGGGGGVHIENGGIFNMSDSSIITNNTAIGGGGGGVEIKFGIFNMSGSASITKNNGFFWCGGVWVKHNGSFKMCDSACITENSGGAGCVLNNGIFTMHDSASITRNSALIGGGVYNIDGKFKMFDSASITQNVAENMGGGIYNGKDGMVELNGGLITQNRANLKYGGCGNEHRLKIGGNATIVDNKGGDLCIEKPIILFKDLSGTIMVSKVKNTANPFGSATAETLIGAENIIYDDGKTRLIGKINEKKKLVWVRSPGGDST